MTFRPPTPAPADDAVRLVPLSRAHLDGLAALTRDPDVLRFTYVPSRPRADFAERWLERYDEGWQDGTRAGFAVETLEGEFLGLAGFVSLDLDGRQGEAGYVLGPQARGLGAATRALRLLSGWGFEGLGLERIELRIDVRNTASERVAERAGYVREGVLRNIAFKEGARADVGVWSRLRGDP